MKHHTTSEELTPSYRGRTRAYSSPGQEPKTVLVVEDDAALCSIMAELLVMEGFRVMQTGSGADALRLARRFRPHAILLDLVLPGRSGLEVLRELRARPETRDCAVIVVSASARLMLDDEVRRADSVLQKPFEVDDLLTHLRQALAKRAGEQSTSGARGSARAAEPRPLQPSLGRRVGVLSLTALALLLTATSARAALPSTETSAHTVGVTHEGQGLCSEHLGFGTEGA